MEKLNIIQIPKGRLASDEDEAKKKREELRRKLLKGSNITIKPDAQGSGETVQIPKGKLASDEDEAKKKREELRRKLLKGSSITIKPDAQGSGETVQIPKGKLASFYWYDDDPALYEAEKAAMKRFYPSFELDKLDDGRMFWFGSIKTGVLDEDMTWYLQAVYDHNHPHNNSMGGSVKIYLVEPDLDEMIKQLDYRPYHLLTDTNNNLYLCTARAEDIQIGSTVTTAVSSLNWAVKWIMAFELVISGDLSPSEFDKELI